VLACERTGILPYVPKTAPRGGEGLHRLGAESRLGLLRHAQELVTVINGIGDFVSNGCVKSPFRNTDSA
jgi:hypothetical protein